MIINRMAGGLIFAAAFGAPTLAFAQVPVIDSANLSAAQSTASNTADIMASNQAIKNLSNQILQSVTGNRTSDAQGGGLMGAGLGGGNSVAQAPSWGQLMSGGPMSWGALSGNSTDLASKLINGLQLVKSLASAFKGNSTGSSDASPIDNVYGGSVNTATMLSALTSQASQGVTARSGAFNQAAGIIGSAADVKGSIDQNTQVQVQTGQTINELIGVANGSVAALNADLIRRLTQQSQVTQMLTYDASASDPFK